VNSHQDRRQGLKILPRLNYLVPAHRSIEDEQVPAAASCIGDRRRTRSQEDRIGAKGMIGRRRTDRQGTRARAWARRRAVGPPVGCRRPPRPAGLFSANDPPAAAACGGGCHRPDGEEMRPAGSLPVPFGLDKPRRPVGVRFLPVDKTGASIRLLALVRAVRFAFVPKKHKKANRLPLLFF